MKILTARYYRAEDWHIKSSRGMAPFLDNSKGGKIILDETVKKVMETINGNTFEEINQKEIISTGMLDVFLKVFVRVGVLKKVINHTDSSGPPLKVEDNEPRQPQALNENPLVSMVIVNYNGDKQLPALLESLKRQTYKHQEIIVVDNNSTDNSCQWTKANHRDTRLIELKRNIGFAPAVNIGIRSASGDYILLLNNDIVLDEMALYELISAVLSHGKKWAAAVPKMKFFNNPAFINSIGNSLYPFAWGSDNFIGYVDFGQFDYFSESFSACFGAVLLNPEVLKAIGLLDCRYKFYYEDMDWCFRAQMYGYPVITATKAEIYHKFGASMSLKSQAFKTRYIVGNRLYFALKNLNRRTMKRFLVNYIFEDIRGTLFYLKNNNLSMVLAYIRGYLRLLASFPALFYKRVKLQKGRKITDDRLIFAKAAPVDVTIMENGAPKLDIYSLRTNYAFLAPFDDLTISDRFIGETSRDFIIWQLQPPREDKKSLRKISVGLIFHLVEPGYYDIQLVGLIRRNLILYLDNQPTNLESKAGDTGKKNNKFEINILAARNILISEGSHILKLRRHSRVQAVVLRKVL
jgi:GT2 family glycosyltransferase